MFLKDYLKKIIPVDLLGLKNLNKFIKNSVSEFVTMKRYENQKVINVLQNLDVFEVPWFTNLSKTPSEIEKKSYIKNRRLLLY